MSRAAPDPFLLAALAICCAMGVLVGSRVFAVAGGTALVLVLPGYVLGHLLVPRAESAQRAALSVGLSLAVAVLAGLGLAWAGLLEAPPLVSALCAVTAGSALLLPDGSPVEGRQERWRSAGAGACVLGLAFVAALLAIAIARHQATAVWRTTGPVALAAQRVGTSRSDLRIDVSNLGPRADRFAISVALPGSGQWHRDDVRVGAGRTWTATVPVPQAAAGRGTAELRSLSDPALVRHVTIWFGPRPDDPWAAPAGMPHDHAATPEGPRGTSADVAPGDTLVAARGFDGGTP